MADERFVYMYMKDDIRQAIKKKRSKFKKKINLLLDME